MKMGTGFLVLAGGILGAGAQTDRPDWENPAVLQIGVEAPRATFFAYPNEPAARSFDRNRSPWFKLLNGDWKFHWAAKPDDRPKEFFRPDFDDGNWKTIPVPSNWEVQGYGLPLYVNITYPFPKDAPNIPHHDNPVGSFRTRFSMSDDWKGRETFLTFDGVNSAFYVWINGEKAGYSQDSRTSAEFNITRFLKRGENLLTVEVYRWCDGSYLEDQDFWRLSGIFRDVYLTSRGPDRIRDFTMATNLDEKWDHAILEVTAELVGAAGSVGLELFDANGGSVLKGVSIDGRFRIPVSRPEKWSAENPYLYTAVLTLKDSAGATVEVIPQRVGFRETEIRDAVFHLNGVPIKFKGVNRHEHNPATGQVVTRETMLRDLELLKKFNINAVRTSHYPNTPAVVRSLRFAWNLPDQRGQHREPRLRK